MQNETNSNAAPHQVAAENQTTPSVSIQRPAKADLIGAIKTGDVVKARVQQIIAPGARVKVLIQGVVFGGFIPASHMGVNKLKHGDEIEAKVLEVELQRQSLVLSRKQAMAVNFLGSLRAGQSVQGAVGNKVEYGWFVNLGQMDGLLHVSEVSQGKEPAKGDKLTLWIKSIDLAKQYVRLSLYEPGEIKSPAAQPARNAAATDTAVVEDEQPRKKSYRRPDEVRRGQEERPLWRNSRPQVRRRREAPAPRPASADAALVKKYAASSAPLQVSIGELFPAL